MTTALVTGGYGFVGSHLRPLLHARGWNVVVAGRRHRAAEPQEQYLRVELTDADTLAKLLGDIRPDVVFHLAASQPQGEPRVERLVADAVGGTLALCSALRRIGWPVRAVLAGSSAQYGDVPVSENPVTEETRCRPTTPYGYAKLAAESLGLALAGDGLDVIPVRAFNHVGPGETMTMAGSLAAQVADVLSNRAERVRVRDLASVRDLTDVRDIAAGYVAIAEHGIPGRTYNLCSERATRVEDVLRGLLAAARLDCDVVVVDSAPGSGLRYQVGSAHRAREETGWSATTPLEKSLADLLISLQALRRGGDARHDGD